MYNKQIKEVFRNIAAWGSYTESDITTINELMVKHGKYVIGEDVECDGTCDEGIHEAENRLLMAQHKRNVVSND